MALDLDVRNVHDVQKLVQLVAALNVRTGNADVPAALARISGGPFSYTLYPRRAPTPAFLWCDTGNQVVVAAAGITSPADGLGVFASSLQPLVGVGTARIQGAALSTARVMLAAIRPLFVQGPRRWVLSGHSYGGASVLALAALLYQERAVQEMRICTFGSPRPGDRGLADVLTAGTVRRYMNAGDPVPRFPPHLDEAPSLTLAAGFPTAINWSRYTQPNGGVVITSDGATSIAQLPPAWLPISEFQLLAWALSDRGFYAAAHSIVTYQIRIGLAAAAVLEMAPEVLPGSPPEPGSLLTAAEFADVAAGAVPRPPKPEVTPMAQGYIPVIFRAKAVRMVSGEYGVQWFNGTVMMGHNRANARQLARKLNLFLRSIQGAASIDHTQFNAALANYWTVCTEASNGFNPPVVVT